MWFYISVIIALFSGSNAVSFDSINPDIMMKNVDRSIDLASQLVKISHKINLQNNGKGAVKSFIFSVEPNAKGHLSYIGAQASIIFMWTKFKFSSLLNTPA